MRQTLLEAERIIGHYSNKIVYPPDSQSLCRCGEYPRFELGGEQLCEGCISKYVEEALPFDSDVCADCDEEVAGGFYVLGEYYCESCFYKRYEIQ